MKNIVFLFLLVLENKSVQANNILRQNCEVWLSCHMDTLLKKSPDGIEDSEKEWEEIVEMVCNQRALEAKDQGNVTDQLCPLLCELCVVDFPDHCPIDINDMCECAEGGVEGQSYCFAKNEYSSKLADPLQCHKIKSTAATNKKTIPNYFTDLWGFKIKWQDPEDGWNVEKQTIIIKTHYNNIKQPGDVSQWTKTGFKQMEIPRDIHQELVDYFKNKEMISEPCAPLLNCKRIPNVEDLSNTELKNITLIPKVAITESMHAKLTSLMKNILEKWINGPDKFGPNPKWISISEEANIFGIRRYLRGASLHLHVDRATPNAIQRHLKTAGKVHVDETLLNPQLGVIMQIDQDIEEDWPLTIIDLSGVARKINMKPGEMLLYENAKVPHGRPFPLKGSFYDNMLVQFH